MAGITLTVEAEGVERVVSEIGRDQAKRIPKFFKRVSVFLRSEFIKSMGSGVDPEGKPLPPPAVWTRIAGIGRGKAIKLNGLVPLLNTGQLRASMGTVALKSDSLEFGWSGTQKKKALAQANGISGRMVVRPDPIKGRYSGLRAAKKDGHQYIRVFNGDGWITKRASGGAVRVRPIPRRFFYLSAQQQDKIVNMFVDDKAV